MVVIIVPHENFSRTFFFFSTTFYRLLTLIDQWLRNVYTLCLLHSGDPQSVVASISREPRKPESQYVFKTRDNKSKVKNWIGRFPIDVIENHPLSLLSVCDHCRWLILRHFSVGKLLIFLIFPLSLKGPHFLVPLWQWLLQNVPSLPPLMVHLWFYKRLQLTRVNKRCVIQVY